MKPFFITVIAVFTALSSLSEGKSADLDYTLQRNDSTSLLITLSFKGNRRGKTVLHLPNTWAGQQTLYKAVSRLQALSKLTSIDTTSQPENYLVSYRPGHTVTIAYILHQGWSGAFRYPFYNRPLIRQALFYFEGYSGLVYPELDDEQPVRCKIAYRGFPEDQFKGNSFFCGKDSSTFATSLHELRNSIFCAGNFRSKTACNKGHQIVMAVYGKFAFANEDAFSSVSKIILEERKFWGDPGPRHYFTLVMSTDDKGSTGGTAHYHSFNLFASSDVPLTEGVLQTISHEYFHNWIGSGLKDPEPDEAFKWFKEGFTDYYALKLLHQTGALSDTGFIKKLNQAVRDYYLSPHFNADSAEFMGKYWAAESWRQLPYRRGLTIALTLDLKIQQKNSSASLDELMRALYKGSQPSMIFSPGLFDRLVLKYAGQEMLDALTKSISGQNEVLTKVLLSNKVYQTGLLSVHKIYDEGFDLPASRKEKKIIGLKAGSNAEKAGLREGMPFTGNAGFWINNTEKPGKVQVLRDGKKEWISYTPVAIVDLQVPQINVN